MQADQFDALPKNPDGNTVVTLLQDPDGDESSLFVSLVGRGANGRRIAVMKSADSTDDDADADADDDDDDDAPPARKNEIELDLGQERGEPFYRRIFAPLISLLGLGAAQTSKAATSFGDNLQTAHMWDGFHRMVGTLHETVWEIMESDDLQTSRQAALDDALAEFATAVSNHFAASPITKIAPTVISDADPATIAADAIDLDRVDKISEDDAMKIQDIAKMAANQAIIAAKAAHPEISGAELAKIGVDASTEVFKAAVQGPAQPSMPDDNLAKQRAESAGEGGAAPDPMAAITATINGLSDTVKKIDRTLHGDGAEDPGLVAVVHKQGEAISATAKRVQKVERSPVSHSDGAPVDPELARKADDDSALFSGSALGDF